MTTVTVAMVWLECGACGTPFGMSQRTYDERVSDKGGFYCPNGHSRAFSAETDKEKIARLQREMESQRAIIRQERDDRWAAERQREIANKKFRNLKKRVLAGMCPVCHRTFQQVARHVASKHPADAQDAGVKVVGESHMKGEKAAPSKTKRRA